MDTNNITFWQDNNNWVGYLNKFPEFISSAHSFQELSDNLQDVLDLIDALKEERREYLMVTK